jgi:hypothetical protein
MFQIHFIMSKELFVGGVSENPDEIPEHRS